MTTLIECQDNMDFMTFIPDGEIDLIVTSPPYNMGKSYEETIPLHEYIASQRACIKECHRVLSPTGSICWQVGNYVKSGSLLPLDIVLYPIFSELGFKLRNRIIWKFGHGLHCKKRFSGRYETILWFTKSDDYTFNLDPMRVPSKYPGKKHYKGPNKGKLSGNPLGKNPSDVWDIPNVKANHVEKTSHPCQFPIGLVGRLVLALTNEGDNVFDPYMGVGGIMAKKLITVADLQAGESGESSWEIKTTLDNSQLIVLTRITPFCPIWGTPAKIVPKDGGMLTIDSPCAGGKYAMSESDAGKPLYATGVIDTTKGCDALERRFCGTQEEAWKLHVEMHNHWNVKGEL